MLAAFNVPLFAYLCCAALIALILLARMTIAKRYSLAIRFFGFNLTLSPGSGQSRQEPRVLERAKKI